MPFDFNEYGDSEETQTAVHSVLNDLESDDTVVDEQMSEVEKRLETASYYRMLLNDSLFTVQNQATKVVELEVRAFIRGRLGVLLNIEQSPQPVQQQFSEEEAQALRALAAKVLNKPAVLTASNSTQSKKPALNKAIVAVPTEPLIKKSRIYRNEEKPVATTQFKTVEHNGKKVKMNVTKQVRGSGGIPMPSQGEMAMITATKAAEAVNSFGVSNLTMLKVNKQGEQE